MINGKTIVITGANSGIGLETLKLLAKGNNKILAVDLRTDRIDALGLSNVFAMVCDVSTKENVDSIFAAATEKLGSIDIFYANAGFPYYETMDYVNWDRVEADQVEAVIEVRVTPQRDEGFDAIAEQIYRFEEVSSVYLMSGAYDLMVTVKAGSMKRLALFVAEKLSTLEHVLSTATHFVLKKYKLEGVIFDERKQEE